VLYDNLKSVVLERVGEHIRYHVRARDVQVIPHSLDAYDRALNDRGAR
jgi:hypothetical protein